MGYACNLYDLARLDLLIDIKRNSRNYNALQISGASGEPVTCKLPLVGDPFTVDVATVRAELANFKKFRWLTDQWVGLALQRADWELKSKA